MVVAIIPLIVAIVGLLMWAFSNNAKVTVIGQWMFIIGLFWTIAAVAGKTVKLF